MRIALTTPTGKVGRRLVQILQEDGRFELILLARRAADLSEEQERRAIVAQGDLYDREYVQWSTEGAQILFWCAPPNPSTLDLREHYRHLARNAASAIQVNSINRVIHLSGMGTQVEQPSGPINGLSDAEGILNQTSAQITHLRPAYFMENFLRTVTDIQEEGTIFLPVSGLTRIPMIAARDVAESAARLMSSQIWGGRRVTELLGPEDVSFDQVAEVVSQAIGTEVRHASISAEQARRAMMRAGVSQHYADQLIDLYNSLERGWLRPQQPRSDASATPTTIRQFVQETIAPAIQAKTKAAST